MPAQKKLQNYEKLENIRRSLKLSSLEADRKIQIKHKKAHKTLKQKGIDIGKIRDHSARLLGAGVLTGSLLLSSPTDIKPLPAPHELLLGLNLDLDDNSDNNDHRIVKRTKEKFLSDTLKTIIPKTPRPLERSEEKLLERIFDDVIGINTKATLEGEHLNTTYGYIGAEQHLRRFPGDTLNQHGSTHVLKEGIAPGLGAWGYFAPSKNELTEDLVETEKWYAVVQTLYLPDWASRQPYLRNWYKYRKVLIVNTLNGKAIVASIADSGPAAWTGKHFGGSPEVMDYLGGPRYKKGPVILFFVDDPENKVPLGPVEYNK